MTNPAEMRAALARIDRFALTQVPMHEPKRGPAVPTFLAAGQAGLLYLPIRPGPTPRIEAWLTALEGAALQRDFTQKSLRQWLRQAPAHRSFTVVCHPVSRAFAAFRDHILSGDYAEIRDTLRKVYKVPMPQVAQVPKMDAGAHHAAFLTFAKFLKGNLNGQTSVRVDAAWASQAAVLQGFSQFLTPDLIAREDHLEADLAYLAQSLGHEPPAMPPPEDDPLLAAIHDAEIEEAIRAAYGRDYAAFGFGDWR